MDEAPGLAATHTVWSSSPCLQDVSIGGMGDDHAGPGSAKEEEMSPAVTQSSG